MLARRSLGEGGATGATEGRRTILGRKLDRYLSL